MTGENVEESFLKCSRVILNKIESGMCTILALYVSYKFMSV